MSLLIIDRRDTKLDLTSGRLAIRVPDEPVRHVPIKLLDRMVVHAGIELSSRLLCALGNHGIPLLLFSPRRHQLAGVLMPSVHKDAGIRLGQFALVQDPALCLRLARLLIRSRWRNLRRRQRQALEDNPALRRPLVAIGQSLADMSDGFGCVQNVDALRGLEGHLARQDFRLLAELLPESAGFAGRNRRPPRDPANALVSLGATLLVAEATGAAWRCGLDPYIGFYHELAHGRPALACDLVEPLRPELHAWVAELFRSQTIRARDFGQDDEQGCRLAKAGRERFYRAWGEWSREPVRRLVRYARGLARIARKNRS